MKRDYDPIIILSFLVILQSIFIGVIFLLCYLNPYQILCLNGLAGGSRIEFFSKVTPYVEANLKAQF